MPKITLDTNCIIALEENRTEAADIRKLIELDRNKEIQVAVVGISASENMPGGGGADSFAWFQDKLSRVGLAQNEILRPMGYWGITFWDWALWSDDEMEDLAKKIHSILFPNCEYNYTAHCKMMSIEPNEDHIEQKWRNRLCDVLVAWSHVFHGRDILVTCDRNFLKESKQAALIDLGCRHICAPKEAVSQCLAALQA
jgi:hypothetical protein